MDKLIRRHPHVFGKTKVKNVDEVWANWEKIKRAEKHGTRHARHSAFDGIPKHLPALLRAEKLVKKARKVLAHGHHADGRFSKRKLAKSALAKELFELAAFRPGARLVGGGIAVRRDEKARARFPPQREGHVCAGSTGVSSAGSG